MNMIHVLIILLQRHLLVFRRYGKTLLIDGLCATGTNFFVFGFLMPLAGLSPAAIVPLYAGLIIQSMIHIGSSRAFSLTYDKKYIKYVQYQLTLPCSKDIVVTYYVMAMMIDMAMVTGPLLALALYLTPTPINLYYGGILIIQYILSLLCCALFFVALSMGVDFTFVSQMMWPRVLVPCITTSSLLIPFSLVKQQYPSIASMMLLNPLTYLAEGLRACLPIQYTGLSLYSGCGGTIIWSILLCFFIHRIIHTRLDLV